MSILGALIANIGSIAVFVALIRRFEVRKGIGLFEHSEAGPENRSSVFRVSVFTSVAATASFIALFGLALAAGAIYEHYHPKPPVEFGIYDI